MKTFNEVLRNFREIEWLMALDPKDTDKWINKRLDQAEAELKKVIRIDEGKVNKILNKTSGCSTNCISCKELAKVISDHSAEILEFGGEG
ncbi:MAG TPA: hypothetical protein ENH41_03350 [Candidatus Omnitrophica bacterium]|nr:hypothetical protein [Candidatus Omnitrophota bacterium]